EPSSAYSGNALPAHRSSRARYLPGADNMNASSYCPRPEAAVQIAGRSGISLNLPFEPMRETLPSGKTFPARTSHGRGYRIHKLYGLYDLCRKYEGYTTLPRTGHPWIGEVGISPCTRSGLPRFASDAEPSRK